MKGQANRSHRMFLGEEDREKLLRKIDIINGDITELRVDAIVNAANPTLLGGGGVDGAIHQKAGRELVAECRLLGGCEVGQAKMTAGYQLPARFVIHTVGPIYSGKDDAEECELLRSCYFESLRVAQSNRIHSIAFPCISCGVYKFPIEKASLVALETTVQFLLSQAHHIEKVTFVAFSDREYQSLQDAFHQLLGEPNDLRKCESVIGRGE